jgi:hypothetical protein
MLEKKKFHRLRVYLLFYYFIQKKICIFSKFKIKQYINNKDVRFFFKRISLEFVHTKETQLINNESAYLM